MLPYIPPETLKPPLWAARMRLVGFDWLAYPTKHHTAATAVCGVVVIRVCWLVRRMTISFFGTFSRNLMLWSVGTDIIHPTDGAGYKGSLISGLVPDPRLPSGRSWHPTQGFPQVGYGGRLKVSL